MPVALCFFLSGAAALILQVLWTRMLGHVFGATALAVSTTLTVFMGGLALGSHLGGKIAPRLKRPILAFAVLETAVGLYGLLVPGLLELMPALQQAAGLDRWAGFWGYALFRFVVVAAILILPTTAMGATLPILAEGVVKKSEHLASRVGGLYAANTFGAVAGAFLAGFVLIPELGIHRTVLLAAAIDLAVAALVWGLFRLGGEGLLLRRLEEQTADELLAELEPVELVPVTPRETRLVLFVFAASGGAAMTLEVLWSRAVGVVIGASTYSFTLILTTFLVGLASGAALMSRRIDRIADPVRVLAWVQVIVGVTAILATMFVDRLPFWLHAASLARDISNLDLYFTSFAITAAVTLPTTLALGAVMPLVVRVLAPSGQDHAGPIVGRAYALNTVGAIVGSFAAGFVILPGLGVERGLALASLISLGLGVALIAGRAEGRRAVIAVALVGVLLIGLAPRWDVRSWTAGLFRVYLARHVYRKGWEPAGRLVYHRDGVATTVTVEAQEEGFGVSLKVNGKVDASDVGDMPTQVLSGLLPVLIHGAPKDALVIGYGSGVTPGAALKAPSVRRLDVAEIEAAVYEAANRHFAHVNHRPFEDPRARLLVDDGRNFLLTRGHTYDVIVSEPSNPWMSGAASLFTRDFFEIARRRLNDGGVFLQWLQLYELAPRNIHALIRTFHSVFPHVLVFSPDPSSNDTFLVGAMHPIRLDRGRLEAAFADDALREELARAKVTTPEDFFGLFLLGTEEIPGFVGPGPLNTDDNALIEFAAPRDLLTWSERDARLPFVQGIEGNRLAMTRKYFTGFRHDAAELELAAQRLLAQGRPTDAKAFAAEAQAAGADTRRLERLIGWLEAGDDQPVVVADEVTKKDEAYARAVLMMVQGKEGVALTTLDQEEGFEKRGTAQRLLYAFLCYRNERLIDADYLIDDVIEDEAFVAKHPAALFYAAKINLERGRTRDGLELMERFEDAVSSESSTVAPSRGE